MNSLGVRNQADLFNRTAPGANTNILAASFTPRQSAVLRITVVLATASVFNITETVSGVTNTYGLNRSVALTAGDAETFTFGASPAASYNFQVENDGIIRKLHVDEVYGAVI